MKNSTVTRPIAEAMENRVLFSAAPVGVDIGIATAQVSIVEADALKPQAAQLVVIDTRVANYQQLVADITVQQDNGSTVELLLIHSEDDALTAIDNAINHADHPFSVIHIVSHGSDAYLELGSTGLSSTVISDRAQTLAHWGNNLTNQADIRIYGCEFAGGASGQRLIADLAVLTGADVAASSDLTGSKALGGNWQLEQQVGQIQSNSVFSAQIVDNWLGILAPEYISTPQPNIVDSTASTDANSLVSANQLARNQNGVIAITTRNPSTGKGEVSFFINEGAQLFSKINLVNPPTAQTNALTCVANSAMTITALNDNHFLVAWIADYYNNTRALCYQIYDETGAALSTNGQVAATNYRLRDVHISGETSTDFVISYLSEKSDVDSNDDKINVIVQKNGLPPGHYQLTEPTRDYLAANIAFVDSTQFLMVFTSRPAGIAGSQILLQSLNVDTTTLASGVTLEAVGSLSNDKKITLDYSETTYVQTNEIQAPQLVKVGDGHFVVGFTEIENPAGLGSQHNAYLMLINADGSTYRAFTRVNSRDLNGAANLRIDYDFQRKLIVVTVTEKVGSTYLPEFVSFSNEIIEIANSRLVETGNFSRQITGLVADNGQFNLLQQGFNETTALSVAGLVRVGLNIGSITVSKPGIAYGSTNYPVSIALTQPPNSNVTLTLTMLDSTTRNYFFTPSDWNIPQSISLPITTAITSGSELRVINGIFSSYDSHYGGVPVQIDIQVAVYPTTLVVTTDKDTIDGITTSIADLLYNPGSDGKISLREAIQAINNTPNNGEFAHILFALESNKSRIQLTSELPKILHKVHINGLNILTNLPSVVIDGQAIVANGLTLGLGAQGSIIEGLSIGNFSLDTVLVTDTGYAITSLVSDVQIKNNWIGINPLNPLSEELSISRSGVLLLGVNNSQVSNNHVSHAVAGITVIGGSLNVISDNAIGTEPAGINVGILNDGIQLYEGASNNLIQNNTVGNCGWGIVPGTENDPGGPRTYGGAGIRLAGLGTDSNRIIGNFLGLSRLGQEIGCANEGIAIHDGASSNKIGGANKVDANFIFYNRFNGIQIWNVDLNKIAVNNSVLINYIAKNGVNENGSIIRALELSSPSGIPPNLIGWGSTTQQDALDADIGANGLLNSLDILDLNQNINQSRRSWAASGNSTSQTVEGIYLGQANQMFRIDFYAFTASEDPQMETYLGTIEITTDSTGKASFNQTFNQSGLDLNGLKATAVVTEITSITNGDRQYGNSSRTSLPVDFSGSLPTLDAIASANVNEGNSFSTNLEVFDLSGSIAQGNWLLSGDTAYFNFDLSGIQPVVRFLPANFENPNHSNTYQLIVAYIDSLGRTTPFRTFTVTVIDVNEPAIMGQQAPNNDPGVLEGQAIVLGQPNIDGTGTGRRMTINDPDSSNTSGFRDHTILLNSSNSYMMFDASVDQSLYTVISTNQTGKPTEVRATGDATSLQYLLDHITLVPTTQLGGRVYLFAYLDPAVNGTGVPSAALSIPVEQFISLPVLGLNFPPVIEGSNLTLDTTMFAIGVDPALLAQNSHFILFSAPTHGYISVNGNTIGSGKTFTYQELASGAVVYTNTLLDNVSESISLRLVDSANNLSEVTTSSIVINPNDKLQPSIDIASVLLAPENNSASFIFKYAANESLDKVTISLGGNNSALFTVERIGTGFARLNWNVSADFDRPNSPDGNNLYTIELTIVDSFGRQSTAVTTVQVTDINETASIQVGIPPAGLEDTPMLLRSASGPIVTIVDPDALGSIQELTLMFTGGTVTVPDQWLSRVSNVKADSRGINKLTLTGNPSELNLILSQLQVQGLANQFGNLSIDFSLADLSPTGIANTAVNKLTINLNAVNDLPTLTLTAGTVNDSAKFTLSAAQFIAADVETPLAQIQYVIVSLPTLGQILLDATPMNIGQLFTQAQLESGAVSYQHRSSGSGEDTLLIAAMDSDGAKSVATSLKMQVTGAPIVSSPPAPVISSAPPAPVAPSAIVVTDSGVTTVKIDNTTTTSSAGNATVSVTPRAATSAPSTAHETNATKANQPSPAMIELSKDRTTESGVADTNKSSLSLKTRELNSQRTSAAQPLANWRDKAMPKSPESIRELERAKEQVKSAGFSQGMNQMRDDLGKGLLLEKTVVSSTVAVSTGVSIGYIIWLLRGGVLLSSLMASLPAWRAFDPLPILSSGVGPVKDSEDDSLENLLKKARKASSNLPPVKTIPEAFSIQ
jgi:hypothetical protein